MIRRTTVPPSRSYPVELRLDLRLPAADGQEHGALRQQRRQDEEDDEGQRGEEDEVAPAQRGHHQPRDQGLEARAHRPEEAQDQDGLAADLRRQVLCVQRASLKDIIITNTTIIVVVSGNKNKSIPFDCYYCSVVWMEYKSPFR